ncbi:MAG: SpoIIE family protein phosphatase [Bacteroidales bacterium]|nr:SpoIIE family protein phosphatase [Bacteroidales bacterium]
MLFLFNNSSAQIDQISVQHYSINDGLSQNFTNSIFQDKFGYIWIATQDGLNRFDGYEFITFRQDPNDENSLSNNYVIDIEGSKDTILWVVTNEGLEKFDYKTNHFSTVIRNKNHTQSVYSTNIKAVKEDASGILWLRTIDGIIRYNPEKNEFLEYKQTEKGDGFISDYNYFSILEDSDHNFWSGSKDGLIKFNHKTKEFNTYKFDKKSGNNEVFSVYFENQEKYWVGTKNGVYTFNPTTEKFNKFTVQKNILNVRAIHKDNNSNVWIGTEYGLMYKKPENNYFESFKLDNYISDEVNVGNVSGIMQDNSDIIWVCSDYGIFKIDSKKKHFNLYRKGKNSSINFSSNTIYSIYYDAETEEIWLGTRAFGLNIFNRKTNQVKIYNKDNSLLTDNNIHCITADEKGNIWVGTSNGPFIYNKFSKSFIPFSKYVNKDFNGYFKNNRISSMFFDSGDIWFSTLNGLLKYSNGKIKTYKKDGTVNSLVANDVFKSIKRKNGEIWVATLHGLSKLNPKTNTFINYTKDNKKISDNSVLTVFESSDQTLWVGTGTGLNKYIPEKDSFIFYTSKSHGFSNDFIYTIAEDNLNNLWLSTNKGIAKFNIKTEEVINFSQDDNLQGYEFNIGAVYSADTINEIFWGGLNGLNSIKLKNLTKNLVAPKPLITKFVKRTQKGKEEVLIGNNNEVFLTYKESSFDINFAVPEYTHPDKNKFKYKIEEANENWIDLGTKNSINFFQLSPGTYTLKLIGANSDNYWNINPVTLIIHISAPWWQTTSAYIFYVAFVIFLVLGGFFIYNKEIRKENKILNEKQIVAKEVEKQRELLSIKNNNIAESMRYASRIIDALLPTKQFVKKLIPDSFVLFMSKEIVSGDFYWVDESKDKVFVAAVDCTGHGVPGAFMSIVGLDLLRNIINQGIDTPGEILDRLNRDVASIFRKDELSGELKDGMDISMIAIHKKDNIIEYAGAINQLFIIRDDNIIEIKGNRFSISPVTTNYGHFKNHTIEVQDMDMIYLFSDGYVDQFGGPDEKKFKYRRFRHMLLNNYRLPVEEQKNNLKRVINSWRGQLEQVDDILVMGIRIKL